MDIGTAKPSAGRAGRGAAPPDRRRRPVGGLVGRALPDRGARRGRRHRSARQARAARSAAPGCTCRPSSTISAFPGEDLDAAGRDRRRASTSPDGARRGVRASSSAATRSRPRASSPANTRRIVRALEVIELTGRAVLVVRSRARRVRARPVVPGRDGRRVAARAALLARPHRGSGSRRCATPGSSTRSGRSPPTPGAGPAPPARPSATRRCWRTWTARSPTWTSRWTPPCAAPGRSPAASGCGSGGIPASPGSATPRIRAPSLPALLAWWCPMTRPLSLAKLHATGNDFLVQSPLDAATQPLAPARRRAALRPPPGIGADGLITIEPGDGRRRLHAWCCTTPTAGGPR